MAYEPQFTITIGRRRRYRLIEAGLVEKIGSKKTGRYKLST